MSLHQRCLRDRGDEGKLPYLFDFGYTTGATGTGLGFVISKGIIEAHEWTITAMNDPDGGARFEILLGDQQISVESPVG